MFSVPKQNNPKENLEVINQNLNSLPIWKVQERIALRAKRYLLLQQIAKSISQHLATPIGSRYKVNPIVYNPTDIYSGPYKNYDRQQFRKDKQALLLVQIEEQTRIAKEVIEKVKERKNLLEDIRLEEVVSLNEEMYRAYEEIEKDPSYKA